MNNFKQPWGLKNVIMRPGTKIGLFSIAFCTLLNVPDANAWNGSDLSFTTVKPNFQAPRDIKISGSIKDEKGEPLQGASVVVKGQLRGP